jgi:hypothetical protein
MNDHATIEIWSAFLEAELWDFVGDRSPLTMQGEAVMFDMFPPLNSETNATPA